MHLQTQKNYASEFIHAPEAAALVPVPLRSFHKYVKDGLFPSYKIGRHRLFKRSEIIATVERQRVGTAHEVLT
jgi:excisionase family DNA binding protein